MIYIEPQVIDAVAKAVQDEYPKAVVENRFTFKPASFPYVSVYETGNTQPSRYIDNTGEELFNEVTYEAQIFTCDRFKVATANHLAEIVDNEMRGLGFLRTFKNAIPNVDTTIHRIVLRYTAVVQIPNGGSTIDKTLVYHR